ncbi:MAG: redoxin domain-containing protein [Flavobacteriaceae bacterium]|jgi:thioredoxin-related protein|nr:redoxin domain-containing protein [Flavobacteriaceae bacterium]
MKEIVLFLLLACSVNVFAQEKLHITGKITGIDNNVKLTLESDFKKKEFQLKDGVIDVEMQLTTVPSLVFMMFEEEGDYKYTTFFVGNENIVLNGSKSDFPNNIKADNSKYDHLRYQEYLMTKGLNEEIDRLSGEARTLVQNGASRDSIYQLYMSDVEPLGKIKMAMKEIDQKTFEFVKEYINTDYGRYLLRYSMRQFSVDQLKDLINTVDTKYKETTEIVFIQSIVNSKPLVVGDSYYDFTAEDINAKQVKFSDYFKGKYVLLDFSTLHCGFCQEAVPKTIKVAEALKEKLTYVTYYVDYDMEGIKEYYQLKENKGHLIWNKKGRLEPIIAMYRQDATPRYLLFNPKGKLIKEFIGLEEDFEVQLNELMR